MEGHPELGVEDDADGARACRVAHRQPRIVAQRGADADGDRVVAGHAVEHGVDGREDGVFFRGKRVEGRAELAEKKRDDNGGGEADFGGRDHAGDHGFRL